MKQNQFEPFTKVLARDSNGSVWKAELYSHSYQNNDGIFHACIGHSWRYCIPYNEETKHLLGTTKEYKEPEIKEWEVKSSNGLFVEKFTSTELKHFIDGAVIINKDFTNFNITRIF